MAIWLQNFNIFVRTIEILFHDYYRPNIELQNTPDTIFTIGSKELEEASLPPNVGRLPGHFQGCQALLDHPDALWKIVRVIILECLQTRIKFSDSPEARFFLKSERIGTGGSSELKRHVGPNLLTGNKKRAADAHV